MLALSIRQPWAELILSGVKTVEYRSRPTRIVGERFWIYAAGTWPVRASARRELERAARVWSRDLAMPGASRRTSNIEHRTSNIEVPEQNKGQKSEGRGRKEGGAPPAWMLELLARIMGRDDLPTGVIVGSAVIEKVSPPADGDGLYRWHLAQVQRAKTLRRPENHPQPVWFSPFGKAA